jgi:hypothetical protein
LSSRSLRGVEEKLKEEITSEKRATFKKERRINIKKNKKTCLCPFVLVSSQKWHWDNGPLRDGYGERAAASSLSED